MNKYLQVTFTNGETYHVSVGGIAHKIAVYYANHDEGEQKGEPSEEWGKVYHNELKYTLGDSGEIINWARNNMDWEDLKDGAERIITENKEFDYDADYRNDAKVKVIKK